MQPRNERYLDTSRYEASDGGEILACQNSSIVARGGDFFLGLFYRTVFPATPVGVVCTAKSKAKTWGEKWRLYLGILILWNLRGIAHFFPLLRNINDRNVKYSTLLWNVLRIRRVHIRNFLESRNLIRSSKTSACPLLETWVTVVDRQRFFFQEYHFHWYSGNMTMWISETRRRLPFQGIANLDGDSFSALSFFTKQYPFLFIFKNSTCKIFPHGFVKW